MALRSEPAIGEQACGIFGMGRAIAWWVVGWVADQFGQEFDLFGAAKAEVAVARASGQSGSQILEHFTPKTRQ